MTGQAAASELRKPQKIILGVVTVLFFVGAFLLLFSANMQKSLDHDEHQFVASGVLLAGEGRVPYRDYAYFHMPNLVFVYAALFATTDYHLLAARIFSTVCAGLSLGLIFYLAFGLFRESHYLLRFFFAAGSVVFLLTNPLFAYTSGKSWNHDLPVLLTLLAFLLLSRGAKGRRAKRWLFLSGVFLGLAIGTRLSFAPLVLPFLLVILLYPGRSSDRNRRDRFFILPLSFALGLLLGLLPSLILFTLAPRQFLFGNFGYARYNTLYRREVGFVEGDVSALAMTFGGKLRYLARYVVSAPGNLLLLLSFVFFALGMNLADLRREKPYRFELLFVLLLVPFLLVGSFAPTPAFFQYFYAPVPFLLLGTLYAIASFQRQEAKVKWSLVLLAHVVVLSGAYGIKSYEGVDALLAPEDWLPVQVHDVGVEIGRAVGDKPVLTLAPIFPLEGGAQIYEEFATGSFAWRIAPFVPEADRREASIVSPGGLREFLSTRPPGGILVGYEGGLEQPLVDYAEEKRYQALELTGGKTLWLSSP